MPHDHAYHRARREHAYRLRQEGLILHKIGERLGVQRERARQMILKHERQRMDHIERKSRQ